MRAAATRASSTRRGSSARSTERRSLRHRGTRTADRGTPGLAPAGGLTIPSLVGIPTSFTQDSGRVFAAELAVRLLRAGVADQRDWFDWPEAIREPVGFLERTLERWVVDAGVMPSGEPLVITMGHGPYATHDGEDGGAPSLKNVWLFLEIEPLLFELRPMIELLGAVHPRLPATFYAQLHDTLHQVVPVWCSCNAAEWLEGFEAYDEESAEEWRPESAALPDELTRKPLGPEALRRAMSAAPFRVQEMMDALGQLRRAAATIRSPMHPDSLWQKYGCDLNQPIFHIVLAVDEGDAIQRSYDDFADGAWQSGEDFAPARMMPFNATRNAALVRVRAEVQAWARALNSIEWLAAEWPKRGTPPNSLVNTLDLGDEPVRLQVRV